MLDFLPVVAGVLADQVEELGLHTFLLAEGDAHIFGVALRAAAGGVQVDRGVGQCVALALLAGCKQHGAHAGGDAHGVGVHRRRDHLHGVVDGQAGVDAAARAVDIHVDGLIGIFAVQVEQLGHNQVGDLIVDGRAQEDDALLEQQAVDVVGAFPTTGTIDHHRNHIHRIHHSGCSLFVLSAIRRGYHDRGPACLPRLVTIFRMSAILSWIYDTLVTHARL